MSIISTILSPLTKLAGSVIDKTVTDKNLAQNLKAQLNMAFMNEGMELLKSATAIIVAEANGTFIQRNWRPVTMLTFVGLVVCKWMGWTDTSVSPEIEYELMQLIKIGLGGYVVGRSAEKIAKVWNK